MQHSGGRHLINQFLAEMDGIKSSNEGVLILAATNAPWHVDPAFRRPGRDAIRGANLVGLSLILPLVAVGLDYARGASLGLWWYPLLALLALPASGVYSCERGWPRNVAAAVTALLALLGYGQFVGMLAIGFAAQVPVVLLDIFRLAVRASQFIMMGLSHVRPQR